jgi:hypothetical protein
MSIDTPLTFGASGLDESTDILTANREESPMLIPLRLAAQKAGANSDGMTCVAAAGIERPAVRAMPKKQEEMLFIFEPPSIGFPTGNRIFRLAGHRNRSI